MVAGAVSGAAAGFVGGGMASGNLRGAFKGAFAGAVTGAVTGGVGAWAQGTHVVIQMAAMGITGGILSDLQGGKFAHGFATAGIPGAVSSNVVIRIIVAGLISEATGGKFASGAVTAALSYAMGSLGQDGSGEDPDACWSASSDGFCFATNADYDRFIEEGPTMAFHLPSLPQGLVDSVAGFGDAFGARYIRDWLDIGGVNYESGAYLGGNVTGTVWGIGTGGMAGARSMAYLGRIGGGSRWGHWINHNRYMRFGPGRMPANGSLPAGPKVPRMSIGPQRSGGSNPHFDLRVRPFDG